MNCKHSMAEIELYLDGELAAKDAERLTAHVSKCNNCERLLNGERSFRQALKEKIYWKHVPSSITRDVREVVMLQAF